MSPYTEPSRIVAAELRVGDHALTNQALRELYGMSRVTTKARTEVAQELRRAGLQVLSDPSNEPLWVRKVAPARAPSAHHAARTPRAWWRRPWTIAAGAALLLILIVASLGSEPPSSADATDQAALSAATETPTGVASAEPTPAPTERAQTLADARAAVADDDYAGALVIAAAIGQDDERSVKRRIARRLAFRATRALRTNDRSLASRLLLAARDYPRTAEVRRAGALLEAAQARERARVAAQRRAAAIARAARRARVEARRQARAEARRRAQAIQTAPSAPSSPAPSRSSPAPPTSGPSTFNWCGKRDGDGDGIYCEGE